MAMMISKFHKIIQSKVVWTAFAILISVAFVGVYTGSKAGGNVAGPSERPTVVGRLFGEEVSGQELQRAFRDVYVMYCMQFGQAINITEETKPLIDHAAWQRIATLKKAAQLGLTATNEQTVELIRRQPIFQSQQTGQFDKNTYNAFVSGFLPTVGMSTASFQNMFRENVLIEKATNIAAQGALVTEDEIRQAFHLYSDLLTVEYAALPRSLAATPEITDEAAKTYFDQNQEQFRMPEKAIVDYVQFAVADYTNDVVVAEEMVSGYYENNKQRFLKPAAPDAAVEAEPEYQALEEVRDSIVQEITMALARRAATEAADTLVASLADETTNFKTETEKAGLKVVDNTPAFAATERVKGIDPYAPFARTAFGLEKDETHYYSDPVVGRDFVYVISLNKKLPSFLPAFDLVKADATEAARMVAAEKAYNEKAEAVYAEIDKAVIEGSTFADAAAKFALELKTVGPFSLTSPLEDEPFGREIKNATLPFDAGTLVEMIPTRDEFLVAYITEKVPGDETVELAAMREGLADSIRSEKSRQLAAAWQEALLDEAGFVDLTPKAEPETEAEEVVEADGQA